MGPKMSLFSPGVLLKSRGAALPLSGALRYEEQLEDQSSAENDTAIAAVRRPLVKERPGVHRGRRDAEVAGVRGVEHVGPELRANALPYASVLDDPEVEVANTIGAQDVTAGAAEALARGSRSG